MTPRLAWIVGLLSAALLGFQLSLMRILSYAQWYHFAYMIISVALLGFGVSGTLLYLFRSSLLRRANLAVGAATSLCSLSLVLSPLLVSQLSLDPFFMVWDPVRFWQLLLFYIVAFLPFFFGATVVGLSFVIHPDRVGRLYFSNLIGSAIGSLGAVLLMEWVYPHHLPYVMALVTVPAIVLAAYGLGRTRVLLIGMPVLVMAVFLIVPLPRLERSQYKGLSKTLLLPDARIVHEKVSPLGVLEVVESSALRYAPGMSLSYQGAIPNQRGVFSDGEWLGSILDVRDTSALSMLEHSIFSLPYRLRELPRALILGSGTGNDIHLALHNSAQSVTGVEMNGGLLDLLAEAYKDESADLVQDERVSLVVGEGRSFLARLTDPYDVIIVPVLDGFVASAAGTHALFENYLFTVESFQTMIDRLTDNGVLVVHSWMTFPPRSPLKTIGMMFEAMKSIGIKNPEQHFAAIRSWNSFCAVTKKEPFTAGELQSVRKFCDENAFDLVYLPGIQPGEVNRYHVLTPPYLYEATMAIINGQEREFADRYPFSIEPATDNQPYFSHFFEWKRLPDLMKAYGATQATFFELGYVLLLVTFVQLALLSFVFIILPLLVRRVQRPPRGTLLQTILYFGSIGFGYMFVEIVMIQKFVLFLGHPVYSVSVIIASMLVFSGVGSYVSERFAERSSKMSRIAFIGIILLLSLHAVFLPPVLSALLPLSFGWRLILCALLLAPLAFLMGFPFPLGLKAISQQSSSLVPYAWGVNGYCSVMSASMAVLLAIELGFVVLFILSILMYSLAALFSTARARGPLGSPSLAR
ncbi:MAG: hypothetical protein AABZ02_07840 [Bacteroidota bacterium]